MVVIYSNLQIIVFVSTLLSIVFCLTISASGIVKAAMCFPGSGGTLGIFPIYNCHYPVNFFQGR